MISFLPVDRCTFSSPRADLTLALALCFVNRGGIDDETMKAAHTGYAAFALMRADLAQMWWWA